MNRREKLPGSADTSLYYKVAVPIFGVLYTVGLFGHIWSRTRALMLELTPYMILITIAAALWPYIARRESRLLLWVVITAAITLALEIIGVKTGLIFGSYTYGETLGVALLGVPLLIGLNWVVVVLGAIAIMEMITPDFWQRILGAAVFTVLFDMVLEPVAVALDYWSWSGGTIPLHNYIAWGIISAGCAVLFGIMRLTYRGNTLVPAVFIIQFLFFLGLRFFAV